MKGDVTRIQFQIKRIAKTAMRPFLQPKMPELVVEIIKSTI